MSDHLYHEKVQRKNVVRTLDSTLSSHSRLTLWVPHVILFLNQFMAIITFTWEEVHV